MSSGKSLNDILQVGPVIQQELLDIITRFRQHRCIITGDIEKMYRQVLVAEKHRNLQAILWRPNPNESVLEYELNTLTYGTASAPFLATRCLQQLGIENFEQYSEASVVVQ